MEEGETDHEDTFREDEDTDESTEDGQQLIDKGECFVSGTENPCTSAEGDLKQDNCKLQLQGPHHCSVCGKAFSRPYHVVRHMATHSGNRPHDCPVCGKRFTRKASLVVHQRVHTGERPYSCSECGVSYAQLACLRRHRLRHASERPYHCSVCRRGFIQRRYLIQHERTHTGERPYHCPVCPKRFASTTGLKEHQKSHTEENLHACSLCDRVFTSTSSLKDHVRKHTGQPGPHPCPLCRRSFNRPGLLKKHMCIHTGDGDTLNPEDNTSKVTLHRCVLCDAYFTPEKLEQHNLLHQRGLPYVCEICGRSFSRKSRLEEHVMSHTGEKPYQCDVCKKRFAIKRVFKKHQQIHTRGGSTTEPLSLSVNSSLPLGGQDQEPDDHLRSHQPNNTMSNQSLSPDGNNGLRDPLVKNRVEDADAGAVIMSDGEEIQSFQPDSQDDADASAVIMSDGEEIQSFQPVIRPKTTRRKIHVCSVCNKSYTRPSRLKEHMKIHIEENEKLHCSICPKSFLRPSLLKKHLRLHMQDGLTAEPLNGTSKDADNHGDPSCNKGSDKTENEEVSVSGLINSDGEEENWKPIIIDQNGCPESQELKEVNSGKPKHCCPVCGRDCQKASALVKHLRIHSGERPYTCPTCGKSFTQQVHMTEHQRIHTGEKPYTCVGCQKSFSFSSALRRHQRLGRCRGGVDKC